MSFPNFVKGLEKHIDKVFGQLLQNSCARNLDVVSKHLENRTLGIEKDINQWNNSEIRLSIPKIFKKDYILKYAILSWYLDPHTRFELQEFLRNRCTQQSLFEFKFLYLESKELLLYTLYRENDCKHGHLFGNILQPGVYETIKYNLPDGSPEEIRRVKDDRFVLFEYIQPKTKKPAFKRGYNDHGSQAPDDVKVRRQLNESIYSYEKELEKQNSILLAKNKQLKFISEILEGIDS